MDPLISQAHAQKVISYIDEGVNVGATLRADGRNFKAIGAERGYFLGPSLFDHVTSDMRIYQEEIFGPVLCVVRVKSFDEAMQLVNAHEYGNGTTIFTANGEAAHAYTHNVQVGMVGVNVPIPVPMAFHSFGGWKRSLFGPLSTHGTDAVRFYTKMKTITARWPRGQQSINHFTMPTMK